MASIASVDIALTASSTTLRRDLNTAEQATRRYTRRAGSAYQTLNQRISGLRNVFLSFVGVLGGAAVLRNIDELSTLADATGINVERFQQLTFALDRNGLSSQQFGNAIRALQTRLVQTAQGTGEAAEAFRILGLEANDLLNLNAEEAFFAIIDALGELDNAQVRTGLAARLLGEELGPRLSRAVRTGSDEIRRQAGRFSPITGEEVESIRSFNDSLSALGRSLQTLAAAFTPIFNFIAPIVENLGALVTQFRSLGVIISSVLFLAITRLISGAITPLFTAMGTTIASSFRLARGFLMGRSSAIQLRASLLAAANALGGTQAQMLRAQAAAIRTGIGFRVLTISTRALSTAMAFLGGPVGLVITALATLGSFFADEIAEMFSNTSDAVDETVDSFETASTSLNSLFTPDSLRMVSAFRAEFDSLQDTVAGSAMIATNAFNGLSNVITDFVTTGTADIQSFVRDTLRQFILLQTRTALFTAFGPAVGTFGGFFQEGGRPPVGRPSIVGEAGPEVFVPDSAGTIVPNDQLGSGTSITYNINAVDSQSFQQALARDPSFVASVVDRGARQQGRRIR